MIKIGEEGGWKSLPLFSIKFSEEYQKRRNRKIVEFANIYCVEMNGGKVPCAACYLTRVLLPLMMVLVVSSERVLIIPFPWPSHYNALEKIGVELMKRGYDVDMIMPSTENYRGKTVLNTTTYEVPGLASNTFVRIAENRLESGSGFGISWLVQYISLLKRFGMALMQDERTAQLAKNADLVLSDTALLFAPIFADYYKLPLVFLSPFGHLPGCMGDVLGNTENPSYVHTFVATSLFEKIAFPQRMNFFQRSFNLFANGMSKILRSAITIPILRPLTKKYSSKTLMNLWRETSMVLIPMDYSLEYPRPESPNVKMIGPLTTYDSKSSLPKHFQEIMRSSENGVIVVSFGITGALHRKHVEVILKTLTSMRYTVIWRYNITKLKGILAEGDSLVRLNVSSHQAERKNFRADCVKKVRSSLTVNDSQFPNTASRRLFASGSVDLSNERLGKHSGTNILYPEDKTTDVTLDSAVKVAAQLKIDTNFPGLSNKKRSVSGLRPESNSKIANPKRECPSKENEKSTITVTDCQLKISNGELLKLRNLRESNASIHKQGKAKIMNPKPECDSHANRDAFLTGSHLKIGNNVHVFDWLPQQELLQQDKTKLLIAHCGINSLYEALFHATQVLCLPLFGEQFDNAGRVKDRNLGKAITLDGLTQEILSDSIGDLLKDDRSRNNVIKVSKRLRRSKESAAEKAANWIETVLEEKGDMTYLRPVGADLPFYVYFSIDVMLFWSLAWMALAASVILLFRRKFKSQGL